MRTGRTRSPQSVEPAAGREPLEDDDLSGQDVDVEGGGGTSVPEGMAVDEDGGIVGYLNK